MEGGETTCYFSVEFLFIIKDSFLYMLIISVVCQSFHMSKLIMKISYIFLSYIMYIFLLSEFQIIQNRYLYFTWYFLENVRNVRLVDQALPG